MSTSCGHCEGDGSPADHCHKCHPDAGLFPDPRPRPRLVERPGIDIRYVRGREQPVYTVSVTGGVL